MIRFEVGSYTVDVESYQWGYKEGVVYLERNFGSTPAGVFYRSKIDGVSTRVLQVAFRQRDYGVLAELRELGLYAIRAGRRVTFYPDTTALATFRYLDWPPNFEVRHSVEGRLEIELPLVEQVN